MEIKVLLATFLFSVFAVLPVAFAQEVITGDFIRTFSSIGPSVPVTIAEAVLGPAGTPVYEMRIDVARTVVQARIDVRPVTAEEAGLEVLPGGTVYSYINVTVKNIQDSDLDEVRMNFRVPKSWMEENNVEISGVKMLRFGSGEWEELETLLISEDSDSVSYVSITHGFSIFAIVGESKVVPQPVEERAEPEIIEVEAGEEIPIDESQRNVVWTVVGIIIVVVVIVVLLMPRPVIRKKLGRR